MKLGAIFALLATASLCVLIMEPSTTLAKKEQRERQKVEIVEPSGVRGWVAITDPNTGEHWVPTNLLSDRGGLVTYPSQLYIHFRSHTTKAEAKARTKRVEFPSGNGFDTNAPRRHNAWYYSLEFKHETNMTGDPVAVSGLNPYVRYNPNRWHFSHVELDAYRHKQRRDNGGNIILWEVQFTPRSTPFPDLPDSFP